MARYMLKKEKEKKGKRKGKEKEKKKIRKRKEKKARIRKGRKIIERQRDGDGLNQDEKCKVSLAKRLANAAHLARKRKNKPKKRGDATPTRTRG